MVNAWIAVLACVFSALVQAGDLTIETPMANVRQGPSAADVVVGTVRKGARVTPLSVEQNYLEVAFGDGGRRGWLYFPAQGWTLAQVRAELDAAAPRLAPVAAKSRPAAERAAEAALAVVGDMPAGVDRKDGRAGADAAWTPIAELGFRRGWMFEGLASGHRHAFHFALPRTVGVRGAKLKLGFTPAAGLGEHSVLRVDVNGLPVYSTALAGGGNTRWVELPLSRKILGAGQGGVVEVVVRASLMVSEDRCMDDRATASFLHIDPDSGLELALAPGDGSVLAAWESLPRHVTLSLPARLDEAAFASALVLVRQLAREGKTADIVRLPRLGDIVVAGGDEVQAALAEHAGSVKVRDASGSAGDVRVVNLARGGVLVFAPQAAAWPAALADSGWMPVARAAAHDVSLARPLHASALPASVDEVSFARLGADVAPRDVVRRAEWRIPLGVDRIPAGRVPARLRLVVTSAPVPDAQPMMLYAYVNEELQDVKRLAGGTERFTLHLAPSAVRGAFNELRLVVQRDVHEGNCQMLATGYPVQIAPGSSVVFDASDSPPADFGGLPRHFAAGFDLLVGREALERPEATLTFLANLLNANRYPFAPQRVRFVPDGGAAPAAPFLVLADAAPEVSGTAVRFDRGQVTVSGHDGEPLLDINRLQHIAVAQLVDWGGQRGLWVKPPPTAPLSAAPALALTFDSVAFIDDGGVVLTLSPGEPDVARVEYPQYRDWFDLFGAYRYWLMALGWIVVVALLVQLYAKVRSHKRVH